MTNATELGLRVARLVQPAGRRGMPLTNVYAVLNLPTEVARIAVDDAIICGLVLFAEGRLYPTAIDGTRVAV